MKVFIFDTETTGLIKNSALPLNSQPKVIEFFGHTVCRETGEISDELEFLVNPGQSLEPIITKITGLTDSDLKDAKPFSFYADEVISRLAGVDAALAHNFSYDYQIVNFDMQRSGKLCAWPDKQICTVQETEWIKGHRLPLSRLHEHLFGEPFSGAHRAREDVGALTRCYLELVKRGDL